jgi:hypothetical protein
MLTRITIRHGPVASSWRAAVARGRPSGRPARGRALATSCQATYRPACDGSSERADSDVDATGRETGKPVGEVLIRTSAWPPEAGTRNVDQRHEKHSDLSILLMLASQSRTT